MSGSISSGVAFGEAETLVARLKEGDESAFSEAFELYKDLIFTVCSKLLAEKGEAMDVTQEVFLTLYRKIHYFRGECTLKTWLYRVTLNHIGNRNRWWRRRSRDRTQSLGLTVNGKTIDVPCNRARPDGRFFSLEVQEALQKGLQDLPFDQRACVILRDVQGLTYEEIAQAMSVQIGTVKSRIARGRERLRELLRDYRPGASL
ncbi:MAG: RNA polymerase sigma factor [Acidobacteriota bacterium]